MAKSQPVQERPLLRVRRLGSRIPSSPQSEGEQTVYTLRPYWLEGDETAFAFHAPDDTLGPFFHAGMTVYATQRRDPVVKDLVVLCYPDGSCVIRGVEKVNKDGYTVVHYRSGEPPITEQVKFKDISEVSIIAGTKRV